MSIEEIEVKKTAKLTDEGVVFVDRDPTKPLNPLAPVITNAEQFAAMSPEMREQVVKPLVDLGLRYKQAFGGWRLLADVLKAEDSTSLWAGAALMCRTTEDRRGTQFCTIMSVVAPSVRAEVLRALTSAETPERKP